MVINVTQSAADHFKHIISSNPRVKGIKLGIKSSGCNGFAYVLDTVEQEDITLEHIVIFDVDFYVEPEALPILDDLTIDLVKQPMGLGSSIKFINPNETGRCGCGQSFSV